MSGFKRTWYSQIVEYYLSIKNGVMVRVTTWMTLENIKERDRKTTYGITPFI